MNRTRRKVLGAGGSAGLIALMGAAGFAAPDIAVAAARNRAAFEGRTVQEAFNALGAASPVDSADIVLTVPAVAENGSLVPVAIESRIPRTESIAILIEKNPRPLTAWFDIPSGTEPGVTLRVKMGATSNLHALVRADGRYFVTRREIKVIEGDCGCEA